MELCCLLWLAAPASAWAQGQLVFDNRVNQVVVAPVFGLDAAHPTEPRRGNDASGFPSGTQSYPGTPLGSAYAAQLFGGSPQTASRHLQPLRPATVFRNNSPGFVSSPPTTVTIPGVPTGTPAKIQLRAWDHRNGTITNWGQVLENPAIPRGESWAFITPPLGGAFTAPPNLIGLTSFSLVTGAVSGLTFNIRFQPDAIPAAPGFTSDYGLPFGPRPGGLRFGWDADWSGLMSVRDSAASPDAVHDSLISIPTGASWSIALSNGLYAVHVTAGDPLVTDDIVGVLVQGILRQTTVTATARWLEADTIVEVTNGLLTLGGRLESTSTPLCAIEIAPLTLVLLEPPPKAAKGANWEVFFNGEAGWPYAAQTSTDLQHWEPGGSLEFLGGDRYRWHDVTGNGTRYYRLSLPLP